MTTTSIDLDEARLAEISELLTTMQTTHQELAREVDGLTNTSHAASPPTQFSWAIALASAIGFGLGVAVMAIAQGLP